jgi:hypothetical protein
LTGSISGKVAERRFEHVPIPIDHLIFGFPEREPARCPRANGEALGRALLNAELVQQKRRQRLCPEDHERIEFSQRVLEGPKKKPVEHGWVRPGYMRIVFFEHKTAEGTMSSPLLSTAGTIKSGSDPGAYLRQWLATILGSSALGVGGLNARFFYSMISGDMPRKMMRALALHVSASGLMMQSTPRNSLLEFLKDAKLRVSCTGYGLHIFKGLRDHATGDDIRFITAGAGDKPVGIGDPGRTCVSICLRRLPETMQSRSSATDLAVLGFFFYDDDISVLGDQFARE